MYTSIERARSYAMFMVCLIILTGREFDGWHTILTEAIQLKIDGFANDVWS